MSKNNAKSYVFKNVIKTSKAHENAHTAYIIKFCDSISYFGMLLKRLFLFSM